MACINQQHMAKSQFSLMLLATRLHVYISNIEFVVFLLSGKAVSPTYHVTRVRLVFRSGQDSGDWVQSLAVCFQHTTIKNRSKACVIQTKYI